MRIKEFVNPLSSFSILAILLYKKTKVRKYDKCLHYPSCSTYGIIAFKKYGFFRAFQKTYSRIKDCHPFSNRPYVDYP